MRRRRPFSLALVIGMLGAMSPVTATAEEPALQFSCQPESGFWHYEAGQPVLSGVICERDQEDGIYRIAFDDAGVKHAFAPGVSSKPGTLRALAEISDTFFYADEDRIYALSRTNFKVTWMQPWSCSGQLPTSPDSRLMGLLVDIAGADGGHETYLKVLSVENGRVVEKLSSKLDLSQHLDFVWQSDRLISIDSENITWWPRQGTAFEPAETIRLAQPLKNRADFEIDDTGMLVIDRSSNRIAYYRFDTKSRSQAHLNATATVRGIGGSQTRAMGITSDLNIVRVVARMGNALQNRYEAKYWRVREDVPIILSSGETLILDGGEDNRSQSIDTSAMTWKRLALMEYRTPGRLADLTNDILTTIHDEGDNAIVRWNARTGQVLSTLQASSLNAIGGRERWPHIERFTNIGNSARYALLELNRPTETNPDLAFVILDLSSMKLVPEGKVFQSKKTGKELPDSLHFNESGFSVADAQDDDITWYLFGERIESKRLSEIPNTPASESLSASEKWYGYCYGENQCVRPALIEESVKQAQQNERDEAWQPELIATSNHQPPLLAWCVSIFSFLALIFVTAWRNGFFAKSQLVPKTSSNDDPFTSSTFEIFDQKNRRFVTDRDNHAFLSPGFPSQTWFRIILSIVVGLGVSLGVAYRFFNDDTMSVFFAWIGILAMPVTAAVWTISSWAYWNRRYLLRFGRFAEGEWLNCAKPNQSIAYTTDDGQTYELSRYQWKRVDFVPIVIYDPARPQFAVQYTGETSYALGEKKKRAEEKSASCSFDLARLSIMALILSGCIAATFCLFNRTYPNPLSIWELDRLSSDPQTFITECLDKCTDGDACFKQCQNRQMRLVYEDAGFALKYDPDITPDQFLRNAHAAMTQTRSIMMEEGASCHAKSDAIQSVALMPESLSHAFWKIYGNADAYKLSHIETQHQEMLSDVQYFQALCDADGACARDAQNCPVVPQCSGSVTLLKTRLCNFARELKIPAIEK